MEKSATVKSRVAVNKSAESAFGKSRGSHNKSAGTAAAAVGFLLKRKFAVGVGLFVLVIGTVIVAGIPKPGTGSSAKVEPAKVESRSSGALTAKEVSYDFGSISMAAGKVTHKYWIRNASTAPVVIRKLYTSCMCTTAALGKAGRKFAAYGMPGHGSIPSMNEPLAPNESATIEVVFDPAAHGPAGVGPIERVVTIENSAGQPLELAFSAVVTP